jgi:hypothetical protein
MAKYTFICEQESDLYADIVESKRTVELYADSLDQILPEFEQFLRGCGFHLDGYIDVVDENDHYVSETEESNFDFSAIPKNNWPFGDLKPASAASDDSIYVSNDIEINLDYGAAQPALHLYDEEDYPAVSFPKSSR